MRISIETLELLASLGDKEAQTALHWHALSEFDLACYAITSFLGKVELVGFCA